MLKGRAVKRLLGDIQGDQLSRIPKGFACDHPAGDLLRRKQYLFFTELSPDSRPHRTLFTEIVSRFKAMTPFIEFLNAPLAAKARKWNSRQPPCVSLCGAVPRRPGRPLAPRHLASNSPRGHPDLHARAAATSAASFTMPRSFDTIAYPRSRIRSGSTARASSSPAPTRSAAPPGGARSTGQHRRMRRLHAPPVRRQAGPHVEAPQPLLQPAAARAPGPPAPPAPAPAAGTPARRSAADSARPADAARSTPARSPAAAVAVPASRGGTATLASPSTRAATIRSSRSSRVGTTSSAAADGVAARRSATKSAIVTSVSCPTADTTGTAHAAMARATASSLNVHRSSSDPPPRPTITRSGHPVRLKYSIPRITSSTDPSPCTSAGYSRMCSPGNRRTGFHHIRDRRPARRRDDPDAPRKPRQRALPLGSEQPLGGQLLLELFEGQLQRAEALRLEHLDHQLILAARLEDVDPPARQHRQPVLRLEFPIAVRRPERHAPHLRLPLLQREIVMPARGELEAGDLPGHPDVRELRVEHRANRLRSAPRR